MVTACAMLDEMARPCSISRPQSNRSDRNRIPASTPLLRTLVAKPRDIPARSLKPRLVADIDRRLLRYSQKPSMLKHEKRLSVYGEDKKMPAGATMCSIAARSGNVPPSGSRARTMLHIKTTER